MRFTIRPSSLRDGRWVVVDTETERCARRGASVLVGLEYHKAATMCASLNRKAATRKRCADCRELTSALNLVTGRCPSCAAQNRSTSRRRQGKM